MSSRGTRVMRRKLYSYYRLQRYEEYTHTHTSLECFILDVVNLVAVELTNKLETVYIYLMYESWDRTGTTTSI